MSNQKVKPGNTSETETNPEATLTTVEAFEKVLVSMVEAWQERQAENRGCTIIQFMKMDPTAFSGSFDPLEAEEWIMKMGELLNLLNCTDEQKVRYATFMLKGNAYHWWKFTERGLTEPVTWDLFQDAFLKHYFPTFFRKLKENEFFELKQGNMSVTDYNTKFIGLSRFAPNVASDKGFLARHFLRGLKPSIKNKLTIVQLGNHPDLVNLALSVEGSFEENRRKRDQRKRPRLGGIQGVID